MITCKKFDTCKRAGIVPERVRRGYGPCRHNGVYTEGPLKGKKCYFVKFPIMLARALANDKILKGLTLAHELARARRSGL